LTGCFSCASSIFGCAPLFRYGEIGFDSGKNGVLLQHCVIEKVVDYLPLEDLKNFDFVDRRTRWYVANSGFYRLLCQALPEEKRDDETWRDAFRSRTWCDYGYHLKIAYCYAFGFPLDFFAPQNDTRRNQYKRSYYSNVPSLNHLYRIVHFETLRQIINNFDVFCVSHDINRVMFSLANAYHILKHQAQHSSPEEQKQLFKNLTQEYSIHFQSLYEKQDSVILLKSIQTALDNFDFRMDSLPQYYMSLVLALPKLDTCDPKYKEYLYRGILKLPSLYKQGAFVMLYERYREPKYQLDSFDNAYLKSIFTFFDYFYRRTKKMSVFSSRFFARYFPDLIVHNHPIDAMTDYVQGLLYSGATHPMLKEWVLCFLTDHIFKNEQIKIDDRRYKIFTLYAVRGLELASFPHKLIKTAPFLHKQIIWFLYFHKILFLRHCLDTNQNKLTQDFLDVEFRNHVLSCTPEKYQETYWRLWRWYVDKYRIKKSE